MKFEAVNKSIPASGSESERIEKIRRMVGNDSQATIKTILTPRKEIQIDTKAKSPQLKNKMMSKKMSMKQIGQTASETPNRFTKL